MKKIQFGLFVFLFFLLTSYAKATTYYASPLGGGDGLSVNTPFQINNFWDIAEPGDILLLMNGVYRGDDSMITPPSNLNGAQGLPISVKAFNDGQVEIDGQNTREPIRLSNNNYFIIEGVNAHSSSWYVVSVNNSNYNIIRRVVAWDANRGSNAMVFGSNYGNENLFEDCAGWGSGRKVIGLFEDTRTTVRRCFFRWSDHNDAGGLWKLGITLGYGSTNTIIENCIGTWDKLPSSSVGQPYAIFGIDNAHNNHGTMKLYGNIAYKFNNQKGEPRFSFSTVNFTANVIYKDLLAYTDPSAMAEDGVFIFGSSSIGNNITEVQGSEILLDNTETPLGLIGGNVLQYGLTENERPKNNGEFIGAQIQFRYINGELTNELLWPWPMEERIKTAMILSGYGSLGGLDGKGGLNLTKIVFELGDGELPDDFGEIYDSQNPHSPQSVKITE